MSEKDEMLEWGSPLEDVPKPENVTLPEGEYSFVVASLEQDRWKPEVKEVGGLLYAKVKLAIQADVEDPPTVTVNLTLSKRNIWRIRKFFECIGHDVRKGEVFMPNWSKVEGRKGTAKLSVRKYKGRNGEERTTNDVAEFLPPKAGVQDIPADNKDDNDDW